MRTILRMFVFAALAASLNACEFFNSKPIENTAIKEEVPLENRGETIDSLSSSEGAVKDTGIIGKEEMKEK